MNNKIRMHSAMVTDSEFKDLMQQFFLSNFYYDVFDKNKDLEIAFHLFINGSKIFTGVHFTEYNFVKNVFTKNHVFNIHSSNSIFKIKSFNDFHKIIKTQEVFLLSYSSHHNDSLNGKGGIHWHQYNISENDIKSLINEEFFSVFDINTCIDRNKFNYFIYKNFSLFLYLFFEFQINSYNNVVLILNNPPNTY